MSKREPVITQWPHHIQNYVSIQEVWVVVVTFFTFLSAVSSEFSLVSDPSGRLGGLVRKVGSPSGRLGGLVRKVGSTCEEFQDIMMVEYWVNVSESSGASSPGLSRITRR